MKITKRMSVGGEWVKAGENVKNGDKIRIEDAGQILAGEFGDRHVFKVLTRKKEELNMSFNQTTLNNLVDAFGEDSEQWMGKVVNAFVIRVMVSGKLRNVAYLAADGYEMDEEGRFQRVDQQAEDPKEQEGPLDGIEF